MAFLLTLVLLATGFGLRARGYLFDPSALWLDECSWAMRIFERPLVQSLIRPLGFLAVSKFLASTFSNSESVLRALPWVAGVVGMLSTPFLARRLYRAPAARLLFVAIIALSPIAIDFAKEFKPYSVSLALHIGLLLLTLRYAASALSKDLALVLGLAAIGSFFAQDLVLAFPGTFLVLGLVALKRGRSHVVATVAVAVAIIAGLALQYFLMWRNLPPDHTEFWGGKYNVFHTPHDRQGYLAWSLDRFKDLVAMPGIRRQGWSSETLSPRTRHGLMRVDEILWVCLHLAGLATLAWQRRWRDALLVALPLLVLWLFNRAGFWPLGAFRTNVFSITYSGAIAALAFDSPRGEGSVWRALVPVALLVLVPAALFEHRWHDQKRTFTYDSTFPRAVKLLATTPPITPGVREVVVLDRRSCDPWRYYTTYNPRVAGRYRADVEGKYDVRCATSDADLPRELRADAAVGHRSWTVLHVQRPFDKLLKSGKFGDLRVLSRSDVGSHTVVALMPRANAREPALGADLTADDASDDDAPDEDAAD